jgi:hypothetical protein
MATRRGHELANGGGFTAEAHAMRRFLRVVSCAPRRHAAHGLLPSPPVTPLLVIAAGVVAIAIGSLLLRSYGPRARVGRLLAVTPTVTIASARDLASTGPLRYVRVDGRLDADEVFPDENDRPLVFRRRRIEARLRGGWRVIDERRESVAFQVREGADEIGVDAEAIEDGLVTLVRESVGTAAEVPGHLTSKLAPETSIRLRIEQLSSVEHAVVLGVPRTHADGAVRMTSGTGRPLVVCTLENEEAMRVLAGGARARPLAAAVSLAGGLVLLAAGIGWALAVGAAG